MIFKIAKVLALLLNIPELKIILGGIKGDDGMKKVTKFKLEPILNSAPSNIAISIKNHSGKPYRIVSGNLSFKTITSDKHLSEDAKRLWLYLIFQKSQLQPLFLPVNIDSNEEMVLYFEKVVTEKHQYEASIILEDPDSEEKFEYKQEFTILSKNI